MNGFEEISDLQNKLLEEIKTYAVKHLEVGNTYKLDAPIGIVGSISATSFELEDLSDDNCDIWFYCESKDEKSVLSQEPGQYVYNLNVYQLSWFLHRLKTKMYKLITLNQ